MNRNDVIESAKKYNVDPDEYMKYTDTELEEMYDESLDTFTEDMAILRELKNSYNELEYQKSQLAAEYKITKNSIKKSGSIIYDAYNAQQLRIIQAKFSAIEAEMQKIIAQKNAILAKHKPSGKRKR